MKHILIIEGVLALCEGSGASRSEVTSYLSARSENVSYWWRILRRSRCYAGYEWYIDERDEQVRITILIKPRG